MRLNGLNDKARLLSDSYACVAYGAYVRASRSALGINQTLFAEMVGVSRPTIVRLEQGLAPLRLALCLAASDLLAKLGAESANIEDFEVSNPKPARLFSSVEFAKVLLIKELLESEIEPAQFIVKILGESFRPPLAGMPLRRPSKSNQSYKSPKDI